MKDTWKTILVIVLGFSILHTLFKEAIFLYIALSVGCISLISPFLAEKIKIIWWGIAQLLGKINATILLSIVFFLLLTPISIFFRLFNRDKLMSKKSNLSSFKVRNHLFVKSDLENTW